MDFVASVDPRRIVGTVRVAVVPLTSQEAIALALCASANAAPMAMTLMPPDEALDLAAQIVALVVRAKAIASTQEKETNPL